MKNNLFKYQFIMFIVMIIFGLLFNPMNVLAYRFNDLYLSLTLFYGGLLMASNMIVAHELVHYFAMGHLNINLLLFGILLSILIVVLLLRKQFLVDDNQWLKRMISHHSTALTTSHKIIKKTKNEKVKELARSIIITQEKEIELMKNLLQKNNI